MELELEENTGIKTVSYLRARDPSILTGNFHLSNIRMNLGAQLLERTDSSSDINRDAAGNRADHLQVYLRIKKTKSFKELYEILENNTLLCKVPEGAHCLRNLRDGSSVTKMFQFSKIFDPQSTQKDLFNDVIKEKVLSFINGFNCTLLTYGASGSGKTFTIVGTADEPGIIPRALEYLFRTLPQLPEQARVKPTGLGGITRLNQNACKLEKALRHSLLKACNNSIDHIRNYKAMQHRLSDEPVAVILDDISDVSLSIWVSYAEIYNENVYDLLKPEPPRGQQRQKLRLGYCNGSAYIKDLTCVSVSSGLEAYQILQFGLHNLKYASTSINDHSSRSHSIFTVKLAQASDTKEGVSVSSFNFCDLAGSERVKKTHNVGERLKESNNINTSLLVLGRCINLVRESQKSNDNRLIPFRESKLTQLFQRALLGQELISMIVNINPVREMFDESQHVLNFSAVAKDVIVEQQQLTKHLSGRFSAYMEKSADFAAGGSVLIGVNIDELQLQVELLQNELEQQKIDSQEDREHVINTYKKILADTNKYWENICQNLQEKLEKNMRGAREDSLEEDGQNQVKRQKMSVIILDTSSEEEDVDASEIKSQKTKVSDSSTDIALLEAEIAEIKVKVQKLTAENRLLKVTLNDGKKAYLDLQLEYQTESKKLNSEIIKQQEKINEQNIYIESFQRSRSLEYINENKENSEPELCSSEPSADIMDCNLSFDDFKFTF